jgi:preprotein translocase SecE subunit
VARDRKRAKQRQQRQQRRAQRSPASEGSELHRADLPGALDHASAEVDEFDAALVRGAHGVPVEAEVPPDSVEAPAEAIETERNGGEDLASSGDGELVPAGAGGGRRGGNGSTAVEAFGEGAAAPAPRERRQPLPRRAISFLRASWAELQRVQWPNRAQVSQATAVVLGFVAVAGFYLGAADWLAQRIVNFVL